MPQTERRQPVRLDELYAALRRSGAGRPVRYKLGRITKVRGTLDWELLAYNPHRLEVAATYMAERLRAGPRRFNVVVTVGESVFGIMVARALSLPYVALLQHPITGLNLYTVPRSLQGHAPDWRVAVVVPTLENSSQIDTARKVLGRHEAQVTVVGTLWNPDKLRSQTSAIRIVSALFGPLPPEALATT